ncbi:mRNA interferase YafQ [Trueperella bonasi]|uniref:mRNA interferase YafQ n=1 Tax=Trueperella bonasi TaxID=312286 RepID=A0ABT9NI82_9ACTO|nr:mRNA interferase YafQ [Trueperella bonasi]
MLIPEYTSSFRKDVKAFQRKHVGMAPLREVMEFILENTDEAKETLRRRFNAHLLKGSRGGSNECHVANSRNWLLIWKRGTASLFFSALVLTISSFDEIRQPTNVYLAHW